MMTRRTRQGFTLIELLVVIAIIAILAAMLFPVFARARESARKIQCLSNVKNIATAVQMYLTDYDRLFPYEHDRMVFAYFVNKPGGGSGGMLPNGICDRSYMANPYLRKATILDEYVKNRDVWRCPSAQREPNTGFIVRPDPSRHWLRAYQDTEGRWGANTPSIGGPCYYAYPSGWGGTVTDTIAQQALATDQTGCAPMTIAMVVSNDELKTSQIDDPSWWVVCGDNTPLPEIRFSLDMLFDLCKLPGWCGADWVNCSWSQSCGIDGNAYEKFFQDATFREKYTRHMGGSNIGFADGHAAWMKADAVMAEVPLCTPATGWNLINANGKIKGLCAQASYEDTKLAGAW